MRFSPSMRAPLNTTQASWLVVNVLVHQSQWQTRKSRRSAAVARQSARPETPKTSPVPGSCSSTPGPSDRLALRRCSRWRCRRASLLWVVFVFVFVFVFSVVRCRVFNWHSTDEKVEAHPKPVGEANEFICTPTAAAVDFCVEGRVRDAQLVCCLSAGQLIDE